VCLSVFNAATCERLDLESSFWYAGTSSEYLGHFLFLGHQVKIKVTGGAKKRVSLRAICLRLKDNFILCTKEWPGFVEFLN